MSPPLIKPTRHQPPIPSGFVMGRQSRGVGPAELLDIRRLIQAGASATVPAAVAAALKAGTNITITDNGDGTYTIAASGGGGGGGAREGNVTKPLVAGFTQLNFGASTTAVDGTTGIILSDPTSTGNMRTLVTATPAGTNFDVYSRIADMQPFASEAGLILRNSTSGRVIFLGMWQNNLVFSRWSSLTAFNANLINSAAHKRTPSWWRFHIDATKITAMISTNGLDWLSLTTTELLATFINAAGGAVDQAGFVASVDGNGANAIIVSSFGFTAPT